MFFGFFAVCGYFADEVFVLECYELRENQSFFDVLVAKQAHDVEDVFGSVVFHGGFPVAEGVEGNLVDSWVLGFVCCSFALSDEARAFIAERDIQKKAYISYEC
jgi:hypothetical protein